MRTFTIKDKQPFSVMTGKLMPNSMEVLGTDDMEVSDGYHTMHELYEHRLALNIALFNVIHEFQTAEHYPGHVMIMKSLKHFDGTMFDGYFIVMMTTSIGQISYHYKLKHWDEFRIPEVEHTPEWDGHGTKEVLERLGKL